MLLSLLIIGTSVKSQTFSHQKSPTYQYPEEVDVLEKLQDWQDLKFGMLIHYGLYSYWGIVESWSICSEEQDWIPRDSTLAYNDYKEKYWGAIDLFNPIKFNPESWARYGKIAGMKYAIFTTKHHDGFNMYDTKYSDFSIAHGAFRDNPRVNIAKEVFEAFRKENYMVGAYYSKPDWHSQYYWWDRYATPNRSQNYNILKNPWRWNKFKEFTYNQIEELMGGEYGALDILWLDGGWVYPVSKERAEKMGRTFRGSPDIDIPNIAKMARLHQPGLLIVDRTIPGKYENYQTPERGIPNYQLTNPWESCIPLGDDWGFTPNDSYKSPVKVVKTLIEIVAKGGNFLLGIGPKPDGTLPKKVETILEEIGEWTSQNGVAIYQTKITSNYRDDRNTWFTESKDGETIYAFYCTPEDEKMPKEVSFTANIPPQGSKIKLVSTGESLEWTVDKSGLVTVKLPPTIGVKIPIFVFSLKKDLTRK